MLMVSESMSAVFRLSATIGTCKVYGSTFKQVSMAFEMGMEIDVGGEETAT